MYERAERPGNVSIPAGLGKPWRNVCAYMMTGTAEEGYKGNGFRREDEFGKKKKRCDVFECSEYASELKARGIGIVQQR